MPCPRPSRSSFSASASLVTYLNCEKNWTSPHIPSISKTGLERARNGKKYIGDNNDLLEFMGDRVVNFACALMAEKIKCSPDHQMWVGRVICNNDTLGRIGYQLRLEKFARLDLHDLLQVQGWSPRQRFSPPKTFADLFEAYVGAVFDEKGWDFTFAWLEDFYKPIIEAASDDFFRVVPQIPAHWHVVDPVPERRIYEEVLLDYLEFKGTFLAESAQEALDALPPASIFVFSPDGSLGNDYDKVEVAIHLIKLWISRISLEIDPELKDAAKRAAHFLSKVTKAVTSEWHLGHIGSLLSLSSYFEPADPDFNCNLQLGQPQNTDHEVVYRTKLSFVLRAAIGWYYLKDPKSAEKWGISWFTPLVHKVHEALVDDARYRPTMTIFSLGQMPSFETSIGPYEFPNVSQSPLRFYDSPTVCTEKEKGNHDSVSITPSPNANPSHGDIDTHSLTSAFESLDINHSTSSGPFSNISPQGIDPPPEPSEEAVIQPSESSSQSFVNSMQPIIDDLSPPNGNSSVRETRSTRYLVKRAGDRDGDTRTTQFQKLTGPKWKPIGPAIDA